MYREGLGSFVKSAMDTNCVTDTPPPLYESLWKDPIPNTLLYTDIFVIEVVLHTHMGISKRFDN